MDIEHLVDKLLNTKIETKMSKKYNLFKGKKGREKYLAKVEEMISK